jgi:hypothetical protein
MATARSRRGSEAVVHEDADYDPRPGLFLCSRPTSIMQVRAVGRCSPLYLVQHLQCVPIRMRGSAISAAVFARSASRWSISARVLASAARV